MNPIIENALDEIQERLVGEIPNLLPKAYADLEYILSGKLLAEIKTLTEKIGEDVLKEKNIDLSHFDGANVGYFISCMQEYPIGMTKVIAKNILEDKQKLTMTKEHSLDDWIKTLYS